MNIEECFRHIPNRLTPEMKIYAHDVVFKDKHYIFYSKDGKQQNCYCTYCKQYFTGTGLKHKHPHICPQCQTTCTARSEGMRRKKLIDEAYFVYYLKSAIDPQCITAVGTYAVRDFSGNFRTVETMFIDQDLFIFTPSVGGVAFHRYTYYSRAKTMESESSFGKAGAVKCQYFRDRNQNIHCTYSRDSIAEAVADTPYRYCTWEQYKHRDMVEFFDLASRYQCVEYLTKLGFSYLIKDKLDGLRTFHAVNWRGKNPLQVLGLSKQELNDIRKNNITMSFLDLKILKLGKRDGSNLTPAEAEAITGTWGHMVEEYLKLKQYSNIRQLNNYLTRQIAKNKIKRYDDCFRIWRDYLADCDRLGMDLISDKTIFPRNLHRAHQNTIKLVKHKEDELLDKKIKTRYEKLEKLTFEHNGLIVIPAASTGEIIAEGVMLKHCIGGYCKGYADGRYDLFFIRRVDEPEDPYYSIEIREGRLVQCYGYDHAKATDEIQNFIDLFIKTMFKKQSRKEAMI